MSWYVLHVGSRTEKKVAAVCARHDIPYYLPLREQVRIYQRRRILVQQPLFRGYVFADLTPDTRTYVLRTNHVLRLIAPPDEGHLMHELDQIRKALAVDPRICAESRFYRGMPVRIIAGVFMGLEGVVDTDIRATKVRLQVEMIGQSVTVEVERGLLEATETAASSLHLRDGARSP